MSAALLWWLILMGFKDIAYKNDQAYFSTGGDGEIPVFSGLISCLWVSQLDWQCKGTSGRIPALFCYENKNKYTQQHSHQCSDLIFNHCSPPWRTRSFNMRSNHVGFYQFVTVQGFSQRRFVLCISPITSSRPVQMWYCEYLKPQIWQFMRNFHNLWSRHSFWSCDINNKQLRSNCTKVRQIQRLIKFIGCLFKWCLK